MNTLKEHELYALLRMIVPANPDVYLRAFVDGLRDMLDKYSRETSALHDALTSALALARPDRLSKDAKEHFNKVLVDRLREYGSTVGEKDALNRYEKAIDALSLAVDSDAIPEGKHDEFG